MSSIAPFQQSPCCVTYPPLDGSLYIPEMIEFNSKHSSAHAFYTFYDKRISDIHHISHSEFYHACQRIAHAVRPDREGPDDAVVGVIANCDTILYNALTMGLIYAGFIPLLMSPRNSPAAVANMMRKTGCHRLIVTRHSLTALLDGISAEFALHDAQPAVALDIQEPPTLAYAFPGLYENITVPFAPYPKANRRPVGDAVMFYLHSSGSTGFPKPIPITFLAAVHWCTTPTVLDHNNFSADLRICAASFPPFHADAVIMQLHCPIATLRNVSMYAPTSYYDPTVAPVIPNAHNTMEVLQRTKATALMVVPAFLEEWVISPHQIERLRGLEYVAFTGGPLAKKAGDTLVAADIKLVSVYGTTEVCDITSVFKCPTELALWEWVRFGPNQCMRWVAHGNGTYECQVLTCPTHQVSVENLPDTKGYATGDAFVKHPTIEGLYKLVGRLDDVLVHSSGEKTVPAPMETSIGSSLFLSGVCMFGRGRNQTGVLVEPWPEHVIDVTDEKQVSEFKNKIWPEVEQANKDAPAFSRIFKEMILVTSKEKRLSRTAKGTVMKKATMKLYESEIDALYAAVEAHGKAGVVPLPLAWSQTKVEDWLLLHAAVANADKPVRVDVDVFEQGFDSLSSTFLKNRILGSLRASPHEEIRQAATRIDQNVVFANPTLRQLASHLIRCVAGEGAFLLAAANPETEIEEMITKFSVGLGHGHVVLLTGSTGGLGSHLLACLLSREDVAVVYAFNRPSKVDTVQDRQRAMFEDRGFDIVLLNSTKLIYIEGDAAQPNLSLDKQTYAKIRDSVTVIIHNAWRVDFNLTLASFEPNVKGTKHLIDLARASKRSSKPRFMFTSSISSAQGWDKSKGPFPEEVQFDAAIAAGAGYGASKYVSERILAMSGLLATSFRIGQITGGARRGAWSTTDWVPIIVKSSVALGAFPDARGVTSWLPPDAVSGAILDVAFAGKEPPTVVNLVHPRPIAWTTLMQYIREAVYKQGLTPSLLPLIPFNKWVARLNTCAVDMRQANIRRMPAIKLLNYMRSLVEGDEALQCQESQVATTEEAVGFPSFVTDVAQRVSKGMQTLKPLSAVDAAQWVDYWVSAGMFSDGVENQTTLA